MGAISITVKHLLACGASHEAVVRAVEEIESQNDIRLYERERKRAQREMSGTNGMSGTKKKAPHTPKEKINPLDNPSGYLPPLPADGPFEEFWAVYPRKVGKGAARKAYRNARKRATEYEILLGAKRYSASKPDPEFTKHPATWLNADCWLDEIGKVIDFRNPPKRTWAEIKAEKERNGQT